MKRVRERVGERESEGEMYGGQIKKKNKAKSLCGLCAFDVLLVFSWRLIISP